MTENLRIDVAILGAVSREVEGLSSSTGCMRPLHHRGADFRTGSYRGRSLLIGTTGLGKVNAAVTVATLLTRFEIGEVWNVGTAGAYAAGPLVVGDVLFSTEALAGDEGILMGNEVLPLRDIGIPLLKRGDEAFYDSFPLAGSGIVAQAAKAPAGVYLLGGGTPPVARLVDKAPLTPSPGSSPADLGKDASSDVTSASRPGRDGGTPPGPSAGAIPIHQDTVSSSQCCPFSRGTTPAQLPDDESLEPAPFRLFHGPSLTVSMVSGDPETAHVRFERYGAFAENMEGSAVVHTCFQFGVPVAEIRGISNAAGNRNREDWRLRTAVTHCQGILLKLLDPGEP